MNSRLAALALCAAGTASAQSLEQQCENAGWADAATTLGGLALGAVEANPLGPLAIVAKPLMLAYIKTLPQEEQAQMYASCAAIWGAAAASNVCVGAAILTGGALAPFCPMAGVAYYFHKMDQSAQELEFWEICKNWKAEHGQHITCTYTPPPAEVREPVLASDIPRISE